METRSHAAHVDHLPDASQSGRSNAESRPAWLPVVASSALVAYGIRRRDLPGFALAGLGGGALVRSLRSTGNPQRLEPARVQRAVTINRPPAEVYRAWRDVEQFPRFMPSIASVQVIDERQSRWTLRTIGGRTVSWTVQITEERENQRLTWQVLDNAVMPLSGEVTFTPTPDGSGTQITMTIDYRATPGAVGAAVAHAFGIDPDIQAREGLRRFKQLLETGEIASIEGQPAGRQPGTRPLGRTLTTMQRLVESVGVGRQRPTSTATAAGR